ncbi:MAG: amino acid adenylation domain-containing protein [Saprospiraceae bacterium]|nr:amino acid adenylation domain-containing protein [Saprospiraceae bacterium]
MMNTLRQLIEEALQGYPDRIAFYQLDGESATYRQLAEGSESVSGMLRPFIQPTDRVAVCLPKSISSVACLFGAVKAGAAYLPLDVDAPVGRNSFILSDARASAILTTPEWAKALTPDHSPFLVRSFSLFGKELVLLQWKRTSEEVLKIPADLAYILYTSGSTGKPKGVMITHSNALCFIHWCANQFEITSSDIFSSIAPFHFDLSIFDLYTAISRGASVVLLDAASVKNPMLLCEVIQRFSITCWYATPTTLKMMLRFGRMERYQFDSLRLILFAGEVFPMAPLNELRSRWSHAAFYNLYGPTETNVCTFFALPDTINPHQEEPFPIGIACPYASCYILVGDTPQPLESGLEGELLVGGQSVMAGYLNNPERNEESLLDFQGERYYRTGDLVRIDENLAIHYHGRKDRMVKRNGYRIELGEIEAALHAHPQISEAGVINHQKGVNGTETQIIAFYGSQTGEEISMIQLQEFLTGFIPVYMLPDQFFHLQEIPKTSTFKVNYPALSASL